MAEPEKQGQLAVLKDAFALTRKNKPLYLLWCALAFVVVIISGYFLGKTLHHPIYFGILGIPFPLSVFHECLLCCTFPDADLFIPAYCFGA